MDDLEIASSRGVYRVRFARAYADVRGAREHLIVDRAVAQLRPGPWLEDVIEVEAGEALKSMRAVEHLAELLLARGVMRGDRLVAVGGATLSDVVGFLAGTLLRGVPWRIVPTTLLAQADACVGGKTGVNVGATKNALGTVTPPDEVHIDVTFLRTLDDAMWRSGLAEVMKAHALEGPGAFDALVRRLPQLRTDDDALEQVVRAALVTKKRFVELDEHDGGARRMLNYGHTFGHAIEAATAFTLPHGHAVALGMRIANRLALALDLLDPVREEKMADALTPLTHDVPAIETADVLVNLTRDKKRVGDGHRFIVLAAGAHAVPAEIRVADDDERLVAAIEAVLRSTRR